MGEATVIRRFSSALFLLFPLSVGADNGKSAWPGPDGPVYVITQNHYAEGFTPGGDTPRLTDLIAIQIFSPKSAQSIRAAYKIGEQLAVFVGAQRRGVVSIKKVMPFQCDSSAAVVAPTASLQFGEDAMALGTNAKNVRPHDSHRRPPNDHELNQIKLLVMIEFQEHGIARKFSEAIKVDQVIVTRVDDTDDKLLIGSLSLEALGAGHRIFLIARITGSGAIAELARYHKTTDLQDGTDMEDVRVVDQLDLDGDGTDEIVLEVTGYESEAFTIYKRTNAQWIKVHVGGQGGC